MVRLVMHRTAEHNAKIGAALAARPDSPTKVCPKCEREMPRTDFGTRKGGRSRSWCRRCEGAEKSRRWAEAHPEYRDTARANNRRTQLRRKYGMTQADYDALLEAQAGGCAVCGGPPTRNREWFDVDHCHATGVVRGLLCSSCNRSIGLLGDDPARMRAAAEYLERASAPAP